MTSRSAGQGPVHFWCSRSIADEVAGWDPDDYPTRFSSGEGHNLLEPYARLRDLGHPVTCGSRIPADARVVVLFGIDRRIHREARANWTAAAFPKVVIRSDKRLGWRPLVSPDLTVVPNGSPEWRHHVDGPFAFLPALPQRGLVPRDPARRGSVRTLVLKANPVNVPAFLRDPGFASALGARGVRLILDVPSANDGTDHRWPDFSDTDVALCIRAHPEADDLLRKPATRAINAWCAGAIPFVAPEPGYLELVTDGVDAFVVRDPDDLLRTLDRLLADPALLAAVEGAVAARRDAFTVAGVLTQWATLLLDTNWATTVPRPDATTVRRQLAAEVLQRLPTRDGLGWTPPPLRHTR